jgi:uncharacterized protein Yka (UPF0111/DUF47 family)
MIDEHLHRLIHVGIEAINSLTEAVKSLHSNNETKNAILHRLAEMENKIIVAFGDRISKEDLETLDALLIRSKRITEKLEKLDRQQ